MVGIEHADSWRALRFRSDGLRRRLGTGCARVCRVGLDALFSLGCHSSGARFFSIARSVQLLSAYACIIIALGGPLLYFEVMFVHVDAHGALVVLMIPVIQTALSMGEVVVVCLWQWRINRNAPPNRDNRRKGLGS